MSQELLYWQALNRAMDIEMAADESVFTLGEDVGLYGGSYRVTEGLYTKYGEHWISLRTLGAFPSRTENDLDLEGHAVRSPAAVC